MSALDALAAAVPKAKPNAAGSPAAPAREPCAPAAAAIPTAEVRAGSKEFAKISSLESFDSFDGFDCSFPKYALFGGLP